MQPTDEAQTNFENVMSILRQWDDEEAVGQRSFVEKLLDDVQCEPGEEPPRTGGAHGSARGSH